MEKRIVWERWYDPLKNAIDDYKSVVKDVFSEHLSNEHLPEDMVLERVFPVRGPILLSNMGPIPLHEGNCPEKLYNFWIGHTNFDITEDVSNEIMKIPGVEILNVWTRYRFRLGVGKAFTDSDVRFEVERKLTGKLDYIHGDRLVKKLAGNMKNRKRKFFIAKDDNDKLVILDDKPKGVNLLYDWDQTDEGTETNGVKPRNRGGDSEQGQPKDNQVGPKKVPLDDRKG